MRYEKVIIGGGMVGAALACALESSSSEIALIDAGLNNFEDQRLIALNHSSYTLFKNLAIWPALKPFATAIQEVHVSNRGHFGITRMRAEELGVDVLGYVVPAKEINRALYQKLAAAKNINLLRPAQLTALKQESSHVTLTLKSDSTIQTLEANYAIAADGTQSTVRELLAIPTEIIDYQQKAIVTITELQRSHRNIAYERFLSNGAIAMLPLADQTVATIWSSNEKNSDALLQLSDDEFLEQLQQQFGYRLGHLIKIRERFVYPLKFVKAKEQINQRVVLIGNAAHTVHPIAAQGLNLALYEIAILAEFFSQQTTEHFSLANLAEQFQQQNASLNLSHRLTQLFSADFFGIKIARQMGMFGLDICQVLKQRFGKRVLGKIGRLPSLLVDEI
ncbi:MAG: FAD-dependent monooxygenase [Gammaproteobacteria bacterium]